MIYLSIIFIFLTILIILLDIFVLKIYENNCFVRDKLSNTELKSNYIKEYSYIKNKKLTNNILSIDSICLEVMQMGYRVDDKEKIDKEKQKFLSNKNEKNSWRIKIPKINLDAPIEERYNSRYFSKSGWTFC